MRLPALRRLPLAAIALAIGSAVTTPAEAQRLIGRVVDLRTGQPAPRLEVALYRQEVQSASGFRRLSWREIRTATTDSVGRFTIDDILRSRTYRILVRHPGYDFQTAQPFIFPATVDSVSLEVRLHSREIQDAIRLRADSAAARAGLSHRLESGLGTILDRDSLARRGARDLATALRELAEVEVVEEFGRPAAMLRRSADAPATCPPMYFLNGGALGGTRAAAAALVFGTPIDSVQLLEVYPDATRLPVVYAAGRGGCGVVGIWTRPPR